jgi:hypothetical protein
MLHVHAGAGTFEDKIAHSIKSEDTKALRLDLDQNRPGLLQCKAGAASG